MKKNKEKLFFIAIVLFLFVIIISGCSRPVLIPGTQDRIMIWQEDENLFKVYFSTKIAAVRSYEGHVITGNISTDGSIESKGYKLNETDYIKNDDNKIDLEIALDNNNYYKGIDLNITEYTYVEFDIKMDDYYRKDITSLGTNINYPEENIIRVNDTYLLNLSNAPFYRKRPVSSLIDKLISDRVFASIYFFIILALIAGIIVFSIKIRKIRKP